MTVENLEYLSAFGAVAFFLVPLYDLYTHNDKVGIKKITPLGWCASITAAYFLIVSLFTISATHAEKTESIRIADSSGKTTDIPKNYTIAKDFVAPDANMISIWYIP
jgi:hypothetical protein